MSKILPRRNSRIIAARQANNRLYESLRAHLTTGIGQGFADDDNPSRGMRFTRGSLGTGIVLGIGLPDLPWLSPGSTTLSIPWEYTFGESQPSLSVDLGMGFGF